MNTPPARPQRVRASRGALARWRACSRLVVDEVSMLDARLFDALDAIARAVRNRPDAPFGGIQLVLCGDFFQLPPVARGGGGEDDSGTAGAAHNYAFAAAAWADAQLAVVTLTEPFRQADPAFVRILAAVRMCVRSATRALHP